MTTSIQRQTPFHINRLTKIDENPVDTFVEIFLDSVLNNEFASTMCQSKDGRSAYTFLCTQMQGDNLNRFVLKIGTNNSVIHEMAGTLFLQAFNITVPVSKQINLNETTLNKINKVYREKVHFKRPNDKVQFQDHSLIVMNYIKGFNFRHLFAHCTVKDLQDLDWDNIHETLGTVAVLDLFIGNLDRLFILGQNNAHWNTGNIMLNMNNCPVFIDTTPDPSFILQHAPKTLAEQIQVIKDKNLPDNFKQKKIAFLSSQSQDENPYFSQNKPIIKMFKEIVRGEGRKQFIATVKKGFDRELSYHRLTFSSLTTSEARLSIGVNRGITLLKEKLTGEAELSKIFCDLQDKLSPVFLNLIKSNLRNLHDS